MISIFIMYSNDRKQQLEKTISFLERMEKYDKCQKTLVVDEKIDFIPDDFEIIKVPRINNKFVWSNMWTAGVATARHEIIWYLDCDRLLPKNYLNLILENIKEDSFLFTSKHFLLLREISDKDYIELLDSPIEDSVFTLDKFIGKLKFEPRLKNPFHGPGKNVMSGNTVFTKNTYIKSKGVDPWYAGHGAYADTDFHMQCSQLGFNFIDLNVCELHCHHFKMENNQNLSKEILDKLGLDNFIYYCLKWNIPLVVAENLAFNCKLPISYVHNKIKEYAYNSNS